MTTTTSATESQISYAQSLLASREVSDTFRATLGDITTLTKREASALIDALRSFPYAPRAPRTTAPASNLEVGVYYKNGEVYRVKVSQTSGRPYAMKLIGRSFEYDSSYIRQITADDKMTLEQACDYGIQFGVCCVCGRELTDETSVARGIGPVCARRF
jgi:hypothetical protein